MRVLVVCAALFFARTLIAQTPELEQIRGQIELSRSELDRLNGELEAELLNHYRAELLALGLPAVQEGGELITHSLMALEYAEEHEQAKWVAHILVPEMMQWNESRTNDFREDPKVLSGTAVEVDYFLKFEQDDGSFKYDGFGYDRGHLAPSADFRWSSKALSESYYYSNMSPQPADFNRGIWAKLENYFRNYIYRHPQSRLLIVTGPVLKEELPKIERGPNKVSIPDSFFKVAYDPVLQRGIGFVLPATAKEEPLESFVLSIAEVEELTGLDLYPSLEDGLEQQISSQAIPADWIPELNQGDVEPLYPPSLPRNHFNTTQARNYADSGKSITVCGTVVSTRLTRNGHVFLNLDKQFPNQVFTVTIWKDDLKHFSYEPEVALEGKCMCFTGKVSDFNGTPSMNVNNEKAVRAYP